MYKPARNISCQPGWPAEDFALCCSLLWKIWTVRLFTMSAVLQADLTRGARVRRSRSPRGGSKSGDAEPQRARSDSGSAEPLRSVRIQAVALSGAPLPEVQVAPCQTILEVKRALSHAAGAPAKYLRLIYEHGELDNWRTVSEENLPTVATVSLVRFAPDVTTFLMIQEDDPLMVNYLLDCAANPNERDELGWTALHRAAHRDHASVAAALIALPEFTLVNAQDGGGTTALHLLAQRGLAACCQMLAQRADFEKLNAPSANGNTALHWAARNGHSAACEALLECPGLASLNSRNSSGWTVLHYAAAAGMVNICEKLLGHPEFSADGALTANGETALHWADKNGHQEVCKVLVDHQHRLDAA